jgi:hypothetical protein
VVEHNHHFKVFSFPIDYIHVIFRAFFKRHLFEMSPGRCVNLRFVVELCSYGTFATGGCDGFVNVWDGNNKKRLYQVCKDKFDFE